MVLDAVVIGSGPGGYVCAIKLAQLGAKVAVVEKGKIGGTCLNVGCIPTKALVHSAMTYLSAQKAASFGVELEGIGLNLEKVMAHKEKTVSTLVQGVRMLLKGNGVDVLEGIASIPHPGKVQVKMADGSTQILKTRNIVIATGSSPEVPPVSLESIANTISSDDALSLSTVPKRLLVIGGGVLGVEFACIWNAFGAKVDMVKRSPLILPPMDEEISQRLMIMLKKKGITVHSGIYVKEIRADGEEKVLLAETKEGEKKEFRADLVLSAMGRVPDFGGLDLDALGVKHDRKGIKVSPTMETSVPGIWAIGDCVGRTFLAPVASAEGIVVAENIMGKGEKKEMDYSVIPACAFSIPECAAVGIKEKDARAQGIPIKVSKFPFSANGRAQAMGETEGLVKVISHADSKKVLGAHILGPHADDLIHEAALAMKKGLTADEVAAMVHIHPSLSEAVLEAMHGAIDKPIHLLTR